MFNKALLLSSTNSGPITFKFILAEQASGSGVQRGLFSEDDVIESSPEECPIIDLRDCIGTGYFGDGTPGLFGMSNRPFVKLKNETTGVTLQVDCEGLGTGFVFSAQNQYLFDGVEAGETCVITIY